MEEQFIPYEQALELKELGFDELCFGWWSYINGNTASFYEYKCTNTELVRLNTFLKNCTAPLWQQAFDWFRITHNLHGSPEFIEKGLWSALIINIKTEDIILDKECDSYEEARLECLKKLIEIVKNE